MFDFFEIDLQFLVYSIHHKYLIYVNMHSSKLKNILNGQSYYAVHTCGSSRCCYIKTKILDFFRIWFFSLLYFSSSLVSTKTTMKWYSTLWIILLQKQRIEAGLETVTLRLDIFEPNSNISMSFYFENSWDCRLYISTVLLVLKKPLKWGVPEW